jgi:Uma2 family endonuclease
MDRMTAGARARATYEDLLQVPDHLIAELIDGELFTSPRPRPRHAVAAGAVHDALRRQYGHGGPTGWWILFEPDVHLGDDVVVPDLAAWRRERVPDLVELDTITVVPDWICEVTSPRTGRLDRIAKMPLYARHAVRFAWIVDPEQRFLEVFRLDAGRWVTIGTYSGEQRVHAEPFDEVELNLAELWGK